MADNAFLIKSDKSGDIRISAEVIDAIAALAALEMDGVAAVGPSFAAEQISKKGTKHKYVRTVAEPDGLDVDIAITLDFDSDVPSAVPKVQEKIKSTIENMTGLTVRCVNIKIIGVSTGAGE